jgi:excisionase family DNA binding protein
MNDVLDRSDPHALLTPSEVASLFHETPKTVGRWDTAGILPAERTRGGHRRFRTDAVDQLIAVLEVVGER